MAWATVKLRVMEFVGWNPNLKSIAGVIACNLDTV